MHIAEINITALEQTTDTLSNSLANAEEKIESLESENNEIKSELNDLKAEMIPISTWEEVFEDVNDALHDLKNIDDIIKSDLTRLSIENVEQNKRLDTVEELAEDNKDALNITTLEIATLKDKNDLLTLQNSIFENSIKTIEARLDILEENAGKGSILNYSPDSGLLTDACVTNSQFALPSERFL